MHIQSMMKMYELLKQFKNDKDWLLYDVGACSVLDQQTYRPMVQELNLSYVGLDIAAGPNVDIVIPENGEWDTVISQKSDITISGQCLEHVKRPWEWIKKVFSITKPEGLVIIIAPWKFHEHRFPVDCWRILPDGMHALFEYVGAQVLLADYDKDDIDCWGVARKTVWERFDISKLKQG